MLETSQRLVQKLLFKNNLLNISLQIYYMDSLDEIYNSILTHISSINCNIVIKYNC